MQEDASQPTELQYSQRQPRLTQRRVKWIIVAAIMLGVIAFLSIWGDPLERRFTAWQRQRALNALQLKCMAYSAPPDQVVYEEDSTAVSRLMSDKHYRPVQISMLAQTNALSPTTMPYAMQAPVVHAPPDWSKYMTFNVPGPPTSSGLAFMHERTSANGKRKLVCVASMMEVRRTMQTDWGEGGNWGMLRALYAWTIDPGASITPDDIPPAGSLYLMGPIEDDGVTPFSDDPEHRFTSPFPLRLNAGQIDQNDAARFTIDYELLGIGHRGTITGELQDDGSVIMRPDSGRFPKSGANISWNVPTTKPTDTR